jgi:hypothetical protein
MTTVDWNGDDLPEELKKLPPGRYVVYPAEAVTELPPSDDEALRQALDAAAAGRWSSEAEATARLLDAAG